MTDLTVYRLAGSQRAASPFDGEGARLFGGRWNSKGRRAVYVAGSEALALLEILVHLDDPYQLNHYRLFQCQLPAAQVQRLHIESLPENWRDDPPPVETAAIGDEWLSAAGMLALAVPSSVAVRDCNYLVNPDHAQFDAVTGSAVELELSIDARLYRR